MKTFTDNAGRVWTVAVTVATIKRVRDLAGVDLLRIVEPADANQPPGEPALLDQLASDPVLLVNVLFAACQPQAAAAGMSDTDFGAAMAGDAIAAAGEALLEELVSFYPSPRQRARLAMLLAAARQVERATDDLLDEAMAAALPNLAETIIAAVRSSGPPTPGGCSTPPPASAESIPTR